MQPIKPMLCEPSEAFDSDKYLFEIKFDGERALFHFDKGSLIIQNRRGDDITFRYPEFFSLANGKQGIVDGEIVAFDSEGKSNFDLLAQRSHLQKQFDIAIRAKKIPLIFMAFDILKFDNEDLTKLPLTKRREILYKEFPPSIGLFQWSLPLDKEGRGIALFQMAKELDLEGIVAKHIDSPYVPNHRGAYWKKIKNVKTIDMIFTKYTINNAGIRIENEEGIAVQVAGKNAPAVKKEIDEKGVVLIEVKYLNKTKYGKLRMPTFKELKAA